MARPTIFTFWEPRGAVPAYLELCRATWDRHGGGGEVVMLDHSNLEEHIGAGVLDLAALRRLSLSSQKDAVLVAVLHARGGLFLDMDTIVCGDLAPIMSRLRHAEMTKFGPHLGVVAARAGGVLTGLWLDEVRAALRRVAAGEVAAPPAWDFIGYRTLERALATLKERAPHRRLVRSTAFGRALWRRFASRKPVGRSASLLRRLPRRVEWELTKRHLARHLAILDRKISIAENGHTGHGGTGRGEQFVHFWLDSDAAVDRVIRPGVNLVQLHNSWLPDWYLRLSREEVLAHPGRLTAVLRHLLDAPPQSRNAPGITQSP
ncbi:MAG: hypothetical protein IT534_04665 [Bauldia sp.]|nr:hypothetical protein [Bauldia sp.]